MPNFNARQFAMKMIRNAGSPQGLHNAEAQRMIAAIENNDAKTGEQIANNLLKTYGLTKEQALQMAAQHFNLR